MPFQDLRIMPSLWGGILLVIGNVVGAGILALPIAIAQLGFLYATLILLFFWVLMMLGAYYFLEANLALPLGSNLISMARAGLGKKGVVIAWICNLVVMYSLISAYIAGGGDLIKINFHYLGITIPQELAIILFLSIFGFIVSRGIFITDHTNRILIITKAIILLITVIGLAVHFNLDNISFIPQPNLSASLLIIVMTSFGFATLIPSLRNYYQGNVNKLKKIIFWGTFIPFVCYVLWIFVIFSLVPYEGDYGLKQMATSQHPLSDLQNALSHSLKISWLIQVMNIFSALCIITSFLANSISLTDFIADGLNLRKVHNNPYLVYLIAYLPAVGMVLFYPQAFLFGLSIAGIFSIIQLLILPALMVWSLRYSNRRLIQTHCVKGDKLLLALILSVGFILLGLTLLK